jgi:DNA-binding XRE family transcriptional regulator
MNKNDRIKMLRILCGYSQGILAELIDVKQPSLASYEKGSYGITEKTLLKLATHLRVDPAYLTFGYPALSGKVWELSKEGKSLFYNLEDLLPQFIDENKFNDFKMLNFIDGDAFLLKSEDNRYCLLFSPIGNITKQIAHTISKVKGGNIHGLLSKSQRSIHGNKKYMTVNLFIRQFDASLFETDGINNDYFMWPPGFFSDVRLPQNIKAVLTFVIDKVLPETILQAINIGRCANTNILQQDKMELYIKSMTTYLSELIETKVAESLSNNSLYEFDAKNEVRIAMEKSYKEFIS